jgi:hypothetical protein
MTYEPNSHNHNHQPRDMEADMSLPPELEALAGRLAVDGALWQSRLPDPERIAERIRAIPHESPVFTSSGERGLMFEDTGSASRSNRVALPNRSRPNSFLQRLGSLAAVAVVLILVGSMALVFYAVHANGTGTGKVATGTSTASTSAYAAFKVTGVTMSVTPASIAGTTCGSNMTVTYQALFHVTSKSNGGTVQFDYTVNNGRGETPASLTFASGETSKVYTFTWSGALPADHTYPAPGGVQVNSPNQLTSALMGPTGQCTAPVAPTCGSNFSSPMSQSYQSTLTTYFGTVPLPPMSRTVPNDASGGIRGYDICSAGTASTITAYMEQNLPAYGWTLVSNSAGMETWKNSKGTINWSVSDTLEWNINWRLPLA